MDSKNAAAYVLSVYPLSEEFQKAVTKIAGQSSAYFSVADLRKMGLRRMISFLRRLNKDAILYVPLQDPQSESIFPLLLGLVALSPVSRIVTINADLSIRHARKSDTITAILRIAAGTLAGLFAWFRSWFTVSWLLRKPLEKNVSSTCCRKVLYINANCWFGLRVGGSVGHIAGVANALSDTGYEVHLASASPQPMIRSAVRPIAVKSLETYGYPQELNSLRFHYRCQKQLRGLSANKYDFLYQRMSLFNFAGVVLSRLWRVMLILEYNGSEVWVAQNWGKPLRFPKMAAAIEQICLSHAHRVVVVSQALADEVMEKGVDPARVICYPNCVDPSSYSPEAVPQAAIAAVRERYGIAPDETLISFVGTFGRWHGAPVLAEAIRNFVDRAPAWLESNKVRFAMIGDGSTMPTVRSLIGGPEYSRWVVFTGLVAQNETVNYLAASDILVSPHVANADGSRFFGSPTKLFEYMAMGKGIIASDLDQIGQVLAGGIRIWFDDPGSRPSAPAILVRPGDLGDLQGAMRLLVENPALRRVIGASARAELLDKYTWRHHVEHILYSLEGLQVPDVFPEKEGSVAIS